MSLSHHQPTHRCRVLPIKLFILYVFVVHAELEGKHSLERKTPLQKLCLHAHPRSPCHGGNN